MLLRVCLLVDQAPLRRQLHNLLADYDVIVSGIRTPNGLLAKLSGEGSDLIIISKSLLPEPALDTIQMLQKLPDTPGIIILADRENPEERAQLLACGCDAVLCTRAALDSIKDAITTIIDKKRAQVLKSLSEKRNLTKPSLNDFVSASPAMQTFMNIVRRIVRSDSSLLIMGETGVGKERLARAIHAEGPRSNGPFIAVNCGALPDALLESELFGHEQGAFTGATRARRGWFEVAHRGTIFLDEIGEMPLHLQVKLLRVLQDKQLQRVGSERFIDIDVRIMAASNRDMAAAVAEKYFRQDLYYRLSVVSLTIPPLRERGQDIPELVENYITHLRAQIGRDVFSITNEAMQALCLYSWPGNVRELINVIERAMLLCNDDEITIHDLPDDIAGTSARHASRNNPERLVAIDGDFPEEWLEKSLHDVKKEFMDRLESAYFSGLLRQSGGKIGETARRAGIQSRSLFDKMKRLGLKKEDFRLRGRLK